MGFKGREGHWQADMNFLSLNNVVKLNSFTFLLFSNLRFEIIYNEVNKRLGPKKAGAKKKKKKS